MYFIHVFESGMNWGLAWSGTENFGSKETYRENLTQSVISSVGVDFCHCSDVHWIYVITRNLQRAPGQVAQSSGPVQAPSKFLGASLVGFLRISWSSCAMRLCEVLQWSSNAWAFERPVRQTFVKVQLLTPKSEGPNNFSWLTEVQSKCQPDTFAKKQWQDSSRGPWMSWWPTSHARVCVSRPKRLVKPRSQGSMDRKKKGKNLRKQGGMSQGFSADDSLIRRKKALKLQWWSDRMRYAMMSLFFASNVCFLMFFAGSAYSSPNYTQNIMSQDESTKIRENVSVNPWCLGESLSGRGELYRLWRRLS